MQEFHLRQGFTESYAGIPPGTGLTGSYVGIPPWTGLTGSYGGILLRTGLAGSYAGVPSRTGLTGSFEGIPPKTGLSSSLNCLSSGKEVEFSRDYEIPSCIKNQTKLTEGLEQKNMVKLSLSTSSSSPHSVVLRHMQILRFPLLWG